MTALGFGVPRAVPDVSGWTLWIRTGRRAEQQGEGDASRGLLDGCAGGGREEGRDVT